MKTRYRYLGLPDRGRPVQWDEEPLSAEISYGVEPVRNFKVEVGRLPLRSDVALVSVRGFLDATTVGEFDQSLQGLLNAGKYKIVVDLSDAHYISSAGWGVFIGEIGRIRGNKGDLVLTGLNEEIENVFKLLEFNSILKVFRDVESAVTDGFGNN